MWQLAPIFRTLLRRKLGVFLLVIQIAFTITIFSNLAFISRQLSLVIHQPPGISDEAQFAVTLRPLNGLINYADSQRDIQDLQQLPGVEQVATTHWVPLAGMSNGSPFRTRPEKDASAQFAQFSEVSPQMLSTLDLKLIAGRDFTEADMGLKTATGERRPKNIIITKALAEALFGKDQNVIGKVIYSGDFATEIIGVSEDWSGFTIPINERIERTVFYPTYDETETEQRYLVRVKNPRDRAAVIEAVNQRLSHNYQNELLSWIDKLDEAKTSLNRQNVVLVNLFLVLMVTLGFVVAFAISGQTLFWITQRTKQIGIRRALGASRQAIIVQLLVENAMICSLGLIVGTLLSLGVNQIVMQASGMLPMPPLFLLSVCMLLLGLCLVSAGVPAWRASRIAPSIATRSV